MSILVDEKPFIWNQDQTRFSFNWDGEDYYIKLREGLILEPGAPVSTREHEDAMILFRIFEENKCPKMGLYNCTKECWASDDLKPVSSFFGMYYFLDEYEDICTFISLKKDRIELLGTIKTYTKNPEFSFDISKGNLVITEKVQSKLKM